MEAREVPPTAPIRAGDEPMHVVTSIVHGIFILLLRKVCLRRVVGNVGYYCSRQKGSFTAWRLGFFCDDDIGSLH